MIGGNDDKNEFLNKFNDFENVFVTKTTIKFDESLELSFYVVMDTTRLVYLMIDSKSGLRDVTTLKELLEHEMKVARKQVASELLSDLEVQVTESVYDPNSIITRGVI